MFYVVDYNTGNIGFQTESQFEADLISSELRNDGESVVACNEAGYKKILDTIAIRNSANNPIDTPSGRVWKF